MRYIDQIWCIQNPTLYDRMPLQGKQRSYVHQDTYSQLTGNVTGMSNLRLFNLLVTLSDSGQKNLSPSGLKDFIRMCNLRLLCLSMTISDLGKEYVPSIWLKDLARMSNLRLFFLRERSLANAKKNQQHVCQVSMAKLFDFLLNNPVKQSIGRVLSC